MDTINAFLIFILGIVGATTTPATAEHVATSTPRAAIAVETPASATIQASCPEPTIVTRIDRVEVPVEKTVEKVVEKIVTVTDSSRISELEFQLAEARERFENVVSSRYICDQVLAERKEVRNRVIERIFPGVLVNGEIDASKVSKIWGASWDWNTISRETQIEEANAGLPERQDAYCQ